MKPTKPNLGAALAMAGGLIYAPLVYFGLTRLTPFFIILFALFLLVLRLLSVRALPSAKRWGLALGAAFFLIALLFFVSPLLAVKIYPVAISLAVASVFALSLAFPPTVIESFARKIDPVLPPEGIRYTRHLTWIWVFFLIANAGIATGLACFASLEAWTLWTGLLSYIAMGTLFIGEMLYRRHWKSQLTKTKGEA